jgi:hypothetical protein
MGVALGPIDHGLVIDSERLWIGQDLMGDKVALGLVGAETDAGCANAKMLSHCLGRALEKRLGA